MWADYGGRCGFLQAAKRDIGSPLFGGFMKRNFKVVIVVCNRFNKTIKIDSYELSLFLLPTSGSYRLEAQE
jgi:hypothetical protein